MHPAAARLKIHSLMDAFDSVDVAARSPGAPHSHSNNLSLELLLLGPKPPQVVDINPRGRSLRAV
jgi:hypothetical protein